MTHLEQMKIKVWKHHFCRTEALGWELRALLLEKLSKVGEITGDDIAWVDDRVQEFLKR